MKQRIMMTAGAIAVSAFAAQATPYYTETGFGDTVSRVNLSPDLTTSTNETLIFNRNSDPRALAIDHVNNRVYYANGNAIWKATLEGTGQALVTATSGAPGDIEIDATNGKVYFSTRFTGTSEAIWSVNTDGSALTKIHDATTIATTNPTATTITSRDVSNISLDLDAGRLYWTADNGGNGGRMALNSSPLAGGAVTQHFVATSRGDAISKMDIDFDTSLVYFTVGSSTNEVRRSTISGGSLTTLVSGVGRPGAIALDLDDDEIFFSVGGTMYQADLDGTNLRSKGINGSSLFSIADIEIGPVPEPGSLALLAMGGLLIARRRRA